MYQKITHSMTQLTLAGALVFAAGCGVDLNEEPYDPGGGAAAECEAATRSRIRILQTARTATLMPPAKPAVPQTLSLNRPNPDTDPDADPTVAIANLRFNAATSTTLCPGTYTVTAGSQTLQGDQVEPIDVGTFPNTVVAPMKNYTWVVAGSITGTGADGIQLIVVDESAIPAGAGETSNAVFVNAIRDSPTIAIDSAEAAGPEVAALPRYGVSDLVPVTPGEAKIELLEGATSKASFTIDKFPVGKNLVVVLYDTFAVSTATNKTQAKLFLTGSGDPLVGNAPGNGIKFTAD